MDMEGSRALAVTQQQAWDALNDPQVLKTCIPGCEKIEASGDNQYAVALAVKIGPVQAKFNGKITLSEVNAPDSYTITFDGQGGAAGFGKGVARVKLSPLPDGPGCLLEYKVQAQVGGKIAQLGQRLIDGVAKGMAEDFFKRFDAEMQRVHPQAYAARQAAAEAVAEAAGGIGAVPSAAVANPQGVTVPTWVWVAVAFAVAVVILLFVKR
ncbi:CoxG family protein [Caenimonas terrae]|uniref:CoxG family protein n=1 Tax=Caenimonas terrae TaxID=696074 RepID=A0ABW0NEK2_9BURK